MDDTGAGHQPGDEPCEAPPQDGAPLTAPIQPLPQQVTRPHDVGADLPEVAAHAIVLDMAPQMTVDIGHHGVPALDPQRPKPLIQQLELVAHPFAFGPTTDGKVAPSTTRDEVREAKKAECPRAAQPIATTASSGMAAKAKHGRFPRLNFEVESREAFLQSREETLRILLVLEAREEVISVTHEVRLASTRLRETLLEPEVQHVMEVDVGEDGRDQAALRGT